MNALELLRQDHRRVESLFDQVQQAEDFQARRQLFEEIRQELEAHARIEETVFYPFFHKRSGFRALIDEALGEHEEMKEMLVEISAAEEDEEFDDLVDELIETVDHHVDEEEAELFARVREELDESELEELGARLEEAKQSGFPVAA